MTDSETQTADGDGDTARALFSDVRDRPNASKPDLCVPLNLSVASTAVPTVPEELDGDVQGENESQI